MSDVRQPEMSLFERRASSESESFLLLSMPWCYQICISKCLDPDRDDLREICARIRLNSRPKIAKSPLPVNLALKGVLSSKGSLTRGFPRSLTRQLCDADEPQ